ncbi:Eukaryotic translation initiation factor [Drechslerella dactyloides]|uniref:Eukaryotic translation initiation factor n=1 Tax=Drechslerella dactyloides TaxID=74499 RepID=A0AAD6IX07_DREDA|nr:Eukaryotic translation initiation factor [Drechslerella dactyloides]
MFAGIDDDVAMRKMRLLTLTSLAANAEDRSLPYSRIAAGLHIPAEEVELWVIDVIRAGLVEGKLSQLSQMFLIHRVAYRNFGKNEWIEVGQRLESWKESLRGILEVISTARRQVENQTEKEKTAAERLLQQSGDGVLGEA